MGEHGPDLAPERLDSWLREQLGRRLVVIGLSLPVAAGEAGSEGEAVTLGAAPAGLQREMERYGEVWLRWLASGTVVDQTLTAAAMREADVVLLWLAERPADERPAALVAFLDETEAAEVREEAVVALVGPGASRALARRLGCDAGFAAGETTEHVVSQLAREALERAEMRRGGSSPPCYL